MANLTLQEIRAKMLKIRDEILELNDSWFSLSDTSELPANCTEYDMYDAYNSWFDFCRKLPSDNLLISILEKKK